MYCRRCGAALHQGVVICPECGARQRRGISSVRCARCGHRVSLGLTVCPHCGRDVHPAGPRWGLWLLGFAIIAVAALWGLDELPMEKVNTEVASVRTRVERVVQFLGPVAVGKAEGAPQAGSTPRATQVIAALPATATLPATEIPVPTEVISPTPQASPTVEVSATVTATEVVLTPTSSPTLEPTATEAPTATATPTSAPTATPTPSGRVTYKVKSGDTLSSIAARYKIAWQDLASANGLTSSSRLGVGQELVIPVKGQAGPAPTATSNAAPSAPTKYTVKAGDTLSGIAGQFGITWQELAAANRLTSTSRLNVGQQLVIPGKGGVSQSSPTPLAARPTPAPPSATPAQAQLLDAPQLVNPGYGSSASGENALIELVWRPVNGMPSGAGYRVTIQWVEGGSPMSYAVPVTTAASIVMPTWLFGRADQPTRQYSWAVRVVRMTTDGKGGEKEILLSPSSETRVFYWN